MNLNQFYYKQNENISQYINQPFGSMPREDSSLRIILFIQPDRLSSPSCFCAISIASRNSGSSLNWNAGLPRLDKFLFFCIDTSHTPDYYIDVSLQNTHFFIKEQGFICAGTQIKPLTNNLTKDKTMANSNYNLYTAQGVSKIYLFLGVHRQNLANTGLTFNTFPRSRIAIQADSEQSARAKLAKNWILLQAWQFKNVAEIDRTFVKGVIYA